MKGIRSLITDLLDLTKIESDRQNKVKRKIDITDIAAVSCDVISPSDTEECNCISCG